MLINCVAYQEGAKLADISGRARSATTCSCPDASSGWRCAIRRRRSSRKCSEEFGLHELAVEDARNGHQRPKIEEYGDSMFVVLHLVELDARQRRLALGEVDVFVGRNYVLSVRNRSAQGFLGVRERAEREPELLRHGRGVRALCADGRGGRPLLPDHRCARDGARSDRGSGSSTRARRASNIERLYDAEAAGHGAQACRRAAARRRPASSTAAACRRSARVPGVLPRRRRPSGAASTRRSIRSATRSAPRSRSTCRW